MARKPRVLDSWAMLAFFQNEPSADQVEKIITEAHTTGTDLLMSVVNVGELWYTITRTHTAKHADAIIADLNRLLGRLTTPLNFKWRYATTLNEF